MWDNTSGRSLGLGVQHRPRLLTEPCCRVRLAITLYPKGCLFVGASWLSRMRPRNCQRYSPSRRLSWRGSMRWRLFAGLVPMARPLSQSYSLVMRPRSLLRSWLPVHAQVSATTSNYAPDHDDTVAKGNVYDHVQLEGRILTRDGNRSLPSRSCRPQPPCL